MLRFLGVGETELQALQHASFPSLDTYAFGFVAQERVKVTLRDEEEQTAKLSAGELFLLCPGWGYSISNLSSRPARLYWLMFDQAHVPVDLDSEEAGGGKAWMDSSRLYHNRLPQVRAWLEELLLERERDDLAFALHKQSRLFAIASLFSMDVHRPRKAEEDMLAFVRQMKQYIEENYYETLDLEAEARRNGWSVTRFYQAFKRYVGLSPHKFVMKIRLDASLRLLSDQATPITEAAHAVGYHDEFYFSRLFKKQMGIAPSEYAARAKKRIVCLAPVYLGDLAALGLSPAYTREGTWAEQLEETVAELEQLKPELIFMYANREDRSGYERLSRIAPTVELPLKGYSWKERLLAIATKLELTTVAERWLGYYEMKVENARMHVRRHLADSPVLLVSTREGRFRLWGAGVLKMRDVFYDDLGIQPPDQVSAIKILDVTSLEEIARFDCNNVLFFIDPSEPESFRTELEEQWRRLKENRTIKRCMFVAIPLPVRYNASVHEQMVDQLVDQLQQFDQ
ncbi:helix-turn-helix domain-containing protein [Paenibacillus turpanensis]|uniref:helix-turn-helix domain-containing protein n=1 Tax=Paenibacillus turpanensis TaxID=2689078 RepID=UPI00140CD709|nr:helix-turn-helix domain-containing protein [Paenibacillus turpanensis]